MRTEAELPEAASTLDYEMWMVHQTAAVLSRGLFGDGPMKNAVVESFGIHARNLVDFFCGARMKPDDLIAADLLPGDAVWAPAQDQELKTVKINANKLIAHMTFGRKVRKQGGWPVEPIVLKLNALFGQLCAVLDDRVLAMIDQQPFLAALRTRLPES